MQKNRAIFLDRDGVIIKDIPYLNDIEKIEFLPGAVEAIRRINKSDYKCIVITNQSGIARGLISLEQLASIHGYINDFLAKNKAKIDGLYYCPHHPSGKIKEYSILCNCRKPKPDLFFRAATQHDIDLTKSVMIGDRDIDAEAGMSAGCTSFLLNQPILYRGKAVVFKDLNSILDFVGVEISRNGQ